MAAQEKALAVVPRTQQSITHHTPPDIFQTGELLARSGYFQDAKDAAQTFVKVLAGRELGIGDIAAMTGIYIVKGKVSLSANLMAALVKRSGRYNYRVKRLDDKGCEIEFFESGQPIGVSAFTEEDAKKAGLAGGDNWKKFPRNMYFARAISNGVKFYCPDVSMTPIYTPDELGALVDGESGEVIEARTEPQRPPAETLVAEPARDTPEDSKALEERKARARGLVTRGLVIRDANGYSVGDGAIRDPHKYLVTRAAGQVVCTCPEFKEFPLIQCVHILAVKQSIVAQQSEQSEEETESMTKLRERIYREFTKLEYSAEDIGEYMRKHEEFTAERYLRLCLWSNFSA
jgi:hypothetical protein